MSVLECTVPVGGVACVPSLLEVDKIFTTQQLKYKKIKLMHLQSSYNEERLCWCALTEKNDLSGYLPLFYGANPMRGIPLSGTPIETGEYISCNYGCYLLCQDDFYQQIVRRLTVFSSYKDVFAAYSAKLLQQGKTLSEECPDCELVRVSGVQTSNQTLGIFWFISQEHSRAFFPVFEEDFPLLRGKNYNTLNWEYLEENDVFEHDGQRYVVCEDEDNLPYIAKSHLQICKCNEGNA